MTSDLKVKQFAMNSAQFVMNLGLKPINCDHVAILENARIFLEILNTAYRHPFPLENRNVNVRHVDHDDAGKHLNM